MFTDNEVATSDADNKVMFWISESITSSNVNTKLRDVLTPVWVTEVALVDDMRMGNGNAIVTNSITIVSGLLISCQFL